MKSAKRIVVGSRGSKLAIIQSQLVIAELAETHPHLQFELLTITTTGDRKKHASLEELGGEGVFVKELEDALSAGRVDLAVHSLKDMPTETPEGFRLAAVTERGDPRDALVSSSGKLAELPPGARVGTGSQRRAVQLLAQRSDLDVRPLRGNVDTRLSKVSSGELDAIVLAAAGLVRLGLESVITEYLPPEAFVPAVGQGALGIEIRVEDDETAELVGRANHEATWLGVTSERAFLESLGGGCRVPIGALATVEDSRLHLVGMVANPVGGEILHAEVEGNALAPEEVGSQLAQRMMGLGAARLLEGSGQ
jgi:hydroxymethylbilane synthase